MATEKTRSDLVTRSLEILGASPAGQNPAAEDVALVDAQVDAVVDRLSSEAIYTAGPDNIALDVFEQLAVCLADAVSADFGQAGSQRAPDASGFSPYDRAIRSFRVITARRPTYSTLAADYF